MLFPAALFWEVNPAANSDIDIQLCKFKYSSVSLCSDSIICVLCCSFIRASKIEKSLCLILVFFCVVHLLSLVGSQPGSSGKNAFFRIPFLGQGQGCLSIGLLGLISIMIVSSYILELLTLQFGTYTPLFILHSYCYRTWYELGQWNNFQLLLIWALSLQDNHGCLQFFVLCSF